MTCASWSQTLGLSFRINFPIDAAIASRTASCEMSLPTLGNSIFPSSNSMWKVGSLPGELHEAADPDAQDCGDSLAQQRLGGRPDRGGTIRRTRLHPARPARPVAQR